MAEEKKLKIYCETSFGSFPNGRPTPLVHIAKTLMQAGREGFVLTKRKMNGKIRDQIDYMMLCVDKFAQGMGLSVQQACEYLYSFKGLDFLADCYEVESTFSPKIVVEDLRNVCRRNGGGLD